jgi:hypothetical protein
MFGETFCRLQPARAGAPREHIRRAAGAQDGDGICETQVQGLALFRGTAASLNKARRIQGSLEAAHRHGRREGAKPLERSSPRAEQAPQGSGRQGPSFSVPRLRRGVHRPAAAALRSGAGVGVVGVAALPRLRWPGLAHVIEGGSKFPRAAARPAGYSALHLAGLLISFPIHQRMALLCVDPLPCSHSAGCSVRLYW